MRGNQIGGLPQYSDEIRKHQKNTRFRELILMIAVRRLAKTTSGGEKGRLIHDVQYCGTWPTGSKTTTGKIRRRMEVLEVVPLGSPLERSMPSGTLLPTWTSGRPCPREESMFWPKDFGWVLLKTTSNTISDKLSIGESLDSTPQATLQLIASSHWDPSTNHFERMDSMEDALAFVSEEEKRLMLCWKKRTLRRKLKSLHAKSQHSSSSTDRRLG